MWTNCQGRRVSVARLCVDEPALHIQEVSLQPVYEGTVAFHTGRMYLLAEDICFNGLSRLFIEQICGNTMDYHDKCHLGWAISMRQLTRGIRKQIRIIQVEGLPG